MGSYTFLGPIGTTGYFYIWRKPITGWSQVQGSNIRSVPLTPFFANWTFEQKKEMKSWFLPCIFNFLPLYLIYQSVKQHDKNMHNILLLFRLHLCLVKTNTKNSTIIQPLFGFTSLKDQNYHWMPQWNSIFKLDGVFSETQPFARQR